MIRSGNVHAISTQRPCNRRNAAHSALKQLPCDRDPPPPLTRQLIVHTRELGGPRQPLLLLPPIVLCGRNRDRQRDGWDGLCIARVLLEARFDLGKISLDLRGGTRGACFASIPPPDTLMRRAVIAGHPCAGCTAHADFVISVVSSLCCRPAMRGPRAMRRHCQRCRRVPTPPNEPRSRAPRALRSARAGECPHVSSLARRDLI